MTSIAAAPMDMAVTEMASISTPMAESEFKPKSATAPSASDCNCEQVVISIGEPSPAMLQLHAPAPLMHALSLDMDRLSLQRGVSENYSADVDDVPHSRCTTPGSLCPSPIAMAKLHADTDAEADAEAEARSAAVVPATGDVIIRIDPIRMSAFDQSTRLDDDAMSSEGESEGIPMTSCDEQCGSLVRKGGPMHLNLLALPPLHRGVSASPSMGGVVSDGAGSQSDREGSVTGGPAKLRNLNPTSQRLRRNAKVNRQLMRFRRVKRHQLQHAAIAAGSAGAHDLLYDADEPPMLRLASYCTCESFEFSDLLEYVETSADLDGSLTLYSDVLHIKQKDRSAPPHATRDIFLFEYGAIVFFNFSIETEAEVLGSLKRFQINSLAKSEMEDFDFYYGTESSVSNDEISLSSTSSLEKLSVACALAQCIKLSVFESGVEREVDANRHLSESLSRTGSIPLSQGEISRTIGRLFTQRNNVNLHFDLLDSPECLWQQDRFKHVYDRLHAYLELGARINLLNQKMGVMKEMFDMLNDQMEKKHANKLEWIIIWLIVFEVVMMLAWDILLKDILGFFAH